MTDHETKRDECWFLKCSRDPDGTLHGDNGFAVASCEKHAATATSFGAWNEFKPHEELNAGGEH